MKPLLRKLLPRFALESYRRRRRLRVDNRNLSRTVEEVFTDIYQSASWGGSKGELCSGSGSTDEQAVDAYITMVSERACTEGFLGKSFVDLGCGDFRVGRRLLPLCSSYVGVDIVQYLIHRNQEMYANDTTRFVHMNIVDDVLPDGDVCFLRQVLQHLSNAQIDSVLKRLHKYSWVFITEHHPTDNQWIRPNIDKVHGGGTRLCDNSGVYLSEPPFGLPRAALSDVLEVVPGVGQALGTDQGVIRTFLYRPRG